MTDRIPVTAFLLAVSATAFAAEQYTQTTFVGERLLVRTADGGSFIPPLDDQQAEEDKRQVGFRDPRISPGGTIVGWLALYPNCCTSYPIPRELVLVKDGAVVRRIRGSGQPIWKWRFSVDETKVVFAQHPTHGDFPVHYELRDINTGTLLEEVDLEQLPDSANLPAWARGMDLGAVD